MTVRLEPRAIAGWALTLIGMIILLFAMKLAYAEYLAAPSSAPGGTSLADKMMALVDALTVMLPKLVWIGVLIVIGSILLARGVELLSTPSGPRSEE